MRVRRVLISSPALLALLVADGCTHRPHDGHWAVEAIDGKDVSGGKMSIAVEKGRIGSGNDGCNVWSFAGTSSIDATMVGCPPEDARDAYWLVVRANRTLPDSSGERLWLRAAGHVIRFRPEAAAQAVFPSPVPPGNDESSQTTSAGSIYLAVLAKPLKVYPMAKMDGVYRVRNGCAMLNDHLLVVDAVAATKAGSGWVAHFGDNIARRLVPGNRIMGGGGYFPVASLTANMNLATAEPVPARCAAIVRSAALVAPLEGVAPPSPYADKLYAAVLPPSPIRSSPAPLGAP